MMGRDNNLETVSVDPADALLQQLFHLKDYETPDTARMIRNKQNIMRQVREANSRRRWSLTDLLEVNIPWFFAEPKYGIAALFIAFAGLQYLGINPRNASQSHTGIYTAADGMAAFEQHTAISTNAVSYPKLPDNLDLFPDQQGDAGVKFVGRIEPKK
ncbi:MAG: hypothetical protein ABFR33_10800 [Verrucomicrobiota bacterium]